MKKDRGLEGTRRALWVAAALVAATPLVAQTWPIEPLVIRVSDARVEPGGEAAIVLRTYASLPVRRGKIRITTGAGGLGAGAGPIEAWTGGVLFDVDGTRVATVTPTPDGLGVDLSFLDNFDFVFNRSDGVIAVLTATVAPDVVPGTDYDLLGDISESELRDPQEDLVLLELRPGRLRIRAAGSPFELGVGNVEVQPGSGAHIEISTGERFAIGSGTLVLDYDPDVLLPGDAPTVRSDPRHGDVDLAVDLTQPGRITIDLDSVDGSFNAEVPGDLLVIDLPTRPGLPLGTTSPLTFAAGTALLDPLGDPIPLLIENGSLEFLTLPKIFRDNFEIGDTGWWQTGTAP
ncbi:MAG: hypothetical protein F9K16_03330 [Thermoanaerobaculia bacterium]|jgi:hypothetical protein|nr:MAG: hypothetical protein F9K16_03330 [Thermoanaerobaculia bacterium]MBZ0103348.1 hypothetical protein [Thermoanaerobaculia bacterium]